MFIQIIFCDRNVSKKIECVLPGKIKLFSVFPSFGTKGLKLFASSASADEENWFCGRPKDKATKQEQRIELIKAFILFLRLQILTFFKSMKQ